ncbi:unnamed protein product [Pleuronectes platessa]|uniref:Uncharacterized protein n=1 Tax=Pleuronectes platessa TaxID=8262 RepID=A0A9N7U0Q2_PLEPL|nr:unnamed protein product [Pleuronectes platessa]
MSVSVWDEAAHLLRIPHDHTANEIPDWISRGTLEYSVSLRVTGAWLIPVQLCPVMGCGPVQGVHPLSPNVSWEWFYFHNPQGIIGVNVNVCQPCGKPAHGVDCFSAFDDMWLHHII